MEFLHSKQKLTNDRHVGILEVKDNNFRMRSIPLETVRPFVMDEIVLSEEGFDVNESTESILDHLASKVPKYPTYSQWYQTLFGDISVLRYFRYFSCWEKGRRYDSCGGGRVLRGAPQDVKDAQTINPPQGYTALKLNFRLNTQDSLLYLLNVSDSDLWGDWRTRMTFCYSSNESPTVPSRTRP